MLREWLDKTGKFVDKNAPAILTGLAVGGVVATAITAFRAGPKVTRIMKEHAEEMDRIDKILDEDEYKKEKKVVVSETAKELIPAVLPPIIFGGLTIASVIVSHNLSEGRAAKKIATLSAAYETARLSLKDLEKSVTEVVPKKAEEIKQHVITEKIKEREATEEDKFMYSNKGKMLCKDVYTNFEFYATKPDIELAAMELSKEIAGSFDNDGRSVADLYSKLGVIYSEIPEFAKEVGWRAEDLWDNDNLPITIATCWDKTGSIPIIGVNTGTARPLDEEGEGSFRRSRNY